MNRRLLPYRQLLTAGRCVNAPSASTGAVDAPRHNLAGRQYLFARALLALGLIVSTIAFGPSSVAASYTPGGYLSSVSSAVHRHRVCHFVAHPGSRFTIVCRWVRS